MDKQAKKNEALMLDIVSLINELRDVHTKQLTAWSTWTQQEKQQAKRQYEELEQTICSKLVEVKYFQSLGDSFIKVTKPANGGEMYLEIVTVYEGSTALNFPAEFEFQVQPITGWYPMFCSCQPATVMEYRDAVDLAIEKGAVLV